MVGIALLAILLIGASAALVLYAVALPRMRSARALDQIQDYGFMSADRVVLDDVPRAGSSRSSAASSSPGWGRRGSPRSAATCSAPACTRRASSATSACTR